jgi:hypothetical protein
MLSHLRLNESILNLFRTEQVVYQRFKGASRQASQSKPYRTNGQPVNDARRRAPTRHGPVLNWDSSEWADESDNEIVNKRMPSQTSDAKSAVSGYFHLIKLGAGRLFKSLLIQIISPRRYKKELSQRI